MGHWLAIADTGLALWDERAELLDRAPVVDLAKARDGLARLRAGEVRSNAGPVDFLHLPHPGSKVQPAEQLVRIGAWGRALAARGIETVLWVGLGGSVLGPRMLHRALTKAADAPDIVFADNLDPESFARLLGSSDPRATHLVLASKSGTTAEVAALGAWGLDWLERAGRAREVTVITGPDGLLAELATARGWSHFVVPPGVGGRWSVLSPVGLCVAAAMGRDPAALLDGARAADEQYAAGGSSVAARYGELVARALADGRSTFPLVVYSDRLELIGHWTQQLFMESLGKRTRRSGRVDPLGITVTAARGTSDQHSMLQEWIDGPPAKLATFVVAPPLSPGPPLAGPVGAAPAMRSVAGHTPRAIALALYAGTAEAMRAAGVPSVTFAFARVDERSLGALIHAFEIACALVAELHDVDAYDQPAVEAGKRTARDLLAKMAAGDALPEELSRIIAAVDEERI